MKQTPLIIATRNAHKAQEIAAILPPEYAVRARADTDPVPDVEENGRTFADNARLKSEAVSAVLPGLVLADDSGLCVDALNGSPGVLSARYAGEHGNDYANNAKLLRELHVLRGWAPFPARFVCALSLAENGREIAHFIGTVEGRITLRPQGLNGFGYDPIFVPQGYSCTMAELPAEVKNSISHRASALQMLADWLCSRKARKTSERDA